MRRIFISEMDGHAHDLAHRYGFGVETIAFCDPQNMENEAFFEEKKAELAEFDLVSLHAPYYELTPCAIDPMIGMVSLQRYEQALQSCMKLGVRRMIVHSGYGPNVYFPEWFVPKSIDFWRNFTRKLPTDFELMIENVLDVKPEYIRRVVEGVADSRVKICLDVGHANVYSDVKPEDWVRELGEYIGHVHLHNNYGDFDAHNAFGDGNISMKRLFASLEECAPGADFCIESLYGAACCEFMVKEGLI